WHPQTVRWIARNQLLLVAKHYPRALLWRYARHIFVAQGLWGLVALRHGRAWSFVRGKCAALRHARRLRNPAGLSQLARILEESEREILEVQQQTGFDTYWAWYFRLT